MFSLGMKFMSPKNVYTNIVFSSDIFPSTYGHISIKCITNLVRWISIAFVITSPRIATSYFNFQMRKQYLYHGAIRCSYNFVRGNFLHGSRLQINSPAG